MLFLEEIALRKIFDDAPGAGAPGVHSPLAQPMAPLAPATPSCCACAASAHIKAIGTRSFIGPLFGEYSRGC